MGRPRNESPIKRIARQILALTTEERNALDVALQIHEEAMNGGRVSAPLKNRGKTSRLPKPAAVTAPEAVNG